MKRKDALTLAGCLASWSLVSFPAAAKTGNSQSGTKGVAVAFVVGPVSNLMDIAGPLEVFADTYVTRDGKPPPAGADSFGDDSGIVPVFAPYLVSDTLNPIKAGRIVQIVPNYTFETAPPPKIIVMGAQSMHSATKLDWIREMARGADVVMSVCTGAYLLAGTGLLDGRRATTHHDFYDDFARTYPKVTLVRGPRFVDDGELKTAGGLTSGIALAIHVLSQMYGDQRGQQLARYLEYVQTERPA